MIVESIKCDGDRVVTVSVLDDRYAVTVRSAKEGVSWSTQVGEYMAHRPIVVADKNVVVVMPGVLEVVRQPDKASWDGQKREEAESKGRVAARNAAYVVSAYDFATGKALWSHTELDVGRPLVALDGEVWTYRLANPKAAYKGGDAEYRVEVRSAATSDLRTAWTLGSTELEEFLQTWRVVETGLLIRMEAVARVSSPDDVVDASSLEYHRDSDSLYLTEGERRTRLTKVHG